MLAAYVLRMNRACLLSAAALLWLAGSVGYERVSEARGGARSAPNKAPHVRDAELAALLKQGAPNCVVYVGGVFEACPEAATITSYVANLPARRRADAGETCAAFLAVSERNTALLATTCMDGLGADVQTKQLRNALGALRQRPDADARQAIARAFRHADARTAGVEPEVLAYVRSSDQEPFLASTASAVAFLVETLFVNAEGAKSAAVQSWALQALATGGNQQLAAQEQWSHIVDKKAGCDALVKSVRRAGVWTDTMTMVMGGHDCAAHFAAPRSSKP
jgi:hypothetical protein